MRTSLGLLLGLVSLFSVGCAAATAEPAEEKTGSAASGCCGGGGYVPPPSFDFGGKLTPIPPDPVVFRSIGGYAGYTNESGHQNGPYHSNFVQPALISSNDAGVTWVLDFDTNDSYLGYLRIIYDTRGTTGVPHVQTVAKMYDLGLAPWSAGGLVIDDAGLTAYMTDTWSHKIVKLALDGNPVSTFTGGMRVGISPFQTTFGYVDGAANVARFSSPTGLARDASGNLYVADTGNHAIRKVAPNGDVSTVARDATNGSTFDPKYLAVAPNGHVYATSHHALYRITTGSITLVAGNPSTPGFVNGTSGTLFNEPRGVAIDRLGDVYVADRDNRVIRKFVVASGEVQTIPQQPAFDPNRGAWDTYGYDDPIIEAPVSLSFWQDRLMFSDGDWIAPPPGTFESPVFRGRRTIRTLNPGAPNPTWYGL